jgi:hypothetical protein
MGELLSLVRHAPGPLQTLVGAVTTRVHRERINTVRERLADVFGYDVSAVRTAAPPADCAEEEETTTAYVVVALPDRWRVVERGHIEVRDRGRGWNGTSTLVTESWGEPSPLADVGVIGTCLYPGRLVGDLTFAAPAVDELEGRRCWVVDARPRPPGEASSGTVLALSVGRRLTDFVGVDHRFWFDAATGIVLRHEGRVDDELCSAIELTDIAVDGPIAGHEFSAPPGAVVRSPHELLRDHLAGMGIDPDTVDLDDPDAVRRAIRGV